MKNKRIYDLRWLCDGDLFEFVDLKGFRNMKVKRVSESGVNVQGDILIGDSWKPLQVGHTISGASQVYLIQVN